MMLTIESLNNLEAHRQSGNLILLAGDYEILWPTLESLIAAARRGIIGSGADGSAPSPAPMGDDGLGVAIPQAGTQALPPGHTSKCDLDTLKERLWRNACSGCHDGIAAIDDLQAKAFRVATVAGEQKLEIIDLRAKLEATRQELMEVRNSENEEIARLNDEFLAQGELVAQLNRNCGRLREALEWFADKDNYADCNVENDGLSVARVALKASPPPFSREDIVRRTDEARKVSAAIKAPPRQPRDWSACTQCGKGVEDCKCDNGGSFPNPCAEAFRQPLEDCPHCGVEEGYGDQAKCLICGAPRDHAPRQPLEECTCVSKEYSLGGPCPIHGKPLEEYEIKEPPWPEHSSSPDIEEGKEDAMEWLDCPDCYHRIRLWPPKTDKKTGYGFPRDAKRIAEQLRLLSHPNAEALCDFERIKRFVSWGLKAANALDGSRRNEET